MNNKLTNPVQTVKTRRPKGLTIDNQRVYLALIDKCYDYIFNNFHKFAEKTKVQISLQLLSKILPSQHQQFSISVKGDVDNLDSIADKLRQDRENL